jgi:hypothetical protein
MKKKTFNLDELIKQNPNVNLDQIEKLKELAKKLRNIPEGIQRPPSPLMRRRVEFGESASARRTVQLSTHRGCVGCLRW